VLFAKESMYHVCTSYRLLIAIDVHIDHEPLGIALFHANEKSNFLINFIFDQSFADFG
jgi:hypothetical protein